VTGQDPGRLLLDKIEAREQALAREAEQARALIEDLAARLRELDEAIDHLQITRKTLLSLAGEPATEPAPAEPPSVLPGHPLYQQILAVFADTARPMRARDLCQALDLPIAPKNTENIRSKLKRLASRGILIETEPGLFTQPAPIARRRASSQPALRNTKDEKGVSSRIAL
jgi:hypothetical protein